LQTENRCDVAVRSDRPLPAEQWEELYSHLTIPRSTRGVSVSFRDAHQGAELTISFPAESV
jgi:hypothetical protein